MNDWPDDLWWNEVEAYANAADDRETLSITASSDLREAAGLLIIVFCCAAAGLLGAMAGLSITRMLRRKRAST